MQWHYPVLSLSWLYQPLAPNAIFSTPILANIIIITMQLILLFLETHVTKNDCLKQWLNITVQNILFKPSRQT